QSIRGLIPIQGRPMVGYVLSALEDAASAGEAVVVGPAALSPALRGTRLVLEGPDLLFNIVAGLSALPGDGPALLLTSDIPFLTGIAVDDFIERSLSTGADLCYPIISESASLTQFPGMRRTYARLREGRFTGGNMML